LLVLEVSARAVEGGANRAVIDLVAAHLGVPSGAVVIASGARSRVKRLVIDADPDLVARRVTWSPS
jgi:uncharacterized protein YggU (UPF0235/DUF167 family)